MPTDYFATFARYNAWANARLYDACETLGLSDYFGDGPDQSGSLHAILNRILVGDRIWIARIEGRTSTQPAVRPDPLRRPYRPEDRAGGRGRAYPEHCRGHLGGGPCTAARIPRRPRRPPRGAAGAGARAFLQPADPPSRPGACDPGSDDAASAVARTDRFRPRAKARPRVPSPARRDLLRHGFDPPLRLSCGA